MTALAILMLLCGQTLRSATAHSVGQRLVRKMVVAADGQLEEVSEPQMEDDDEMMGSKALAILNEVEEIVKSGAAPESSKIKVIKDIVTGELVPDLKATRKAAVDQVGVNLEAIKTCNANMLSRSTAISSSTEVSVGQSRTAHATCREAEKGKNSTKGSACQALDDFLNGISVPANLPNPRQRDAMVKYVQTMSEYFCPKGPTATTLDEKCTAATNAHASHKAECDRSQASFENAFCTWRTQLMDRCTAQSQCYKGTLAVFNEHVGATKTLVKKWKVEYAALKKILCYTDVWLNDNNAKTVDAEQLKTCESSTIDTSPMDIDFPAAPAKATCSLDAVQNHPGTSGFVTTEYANFKDYVVTVIPCLGVTPGPTLAPICTDPSKPTTLVENGGFEKGLPGPGWKCWHKPGDVIKNDCHAHKNFWGHSTTGHLHGHCHHHTQGGIEQTVATKAGIKYKLKFVAFEGDWDGNDIDSVHVKIENSDKDKWTTFKIHSPKSNSGWKTLTVDFTANGPAKIVMWADKQHCIDVDDVQLLSC